MKKVLFISLIILLLCTMVVAGFYLITQRGVFARDVSVRIPGSQIPVLTDTLGLNDSNIILDALKSTEKVEAIPPRFSYKISLHVVYRPDITKIYPIHINPYTGEGCIEKGLFKSTYFMIPSETMAYILSSDESYLVKSPESSEKETLDDSFYNGFRSSLEYIGGKPETSEYISEYQLSIRTTVLDSIMFTILVDFSNEKVYAGTFGGYYSVSSEMSAALLSMDFIYSDYKEIMQPLPVITLSAAAPIKPSYTDIRWMRTKPADEVVSESIVKTDEQEADSLEPGLSLFAGYDPGQKPDGIILYEYHDGSLFKEYNLLVENATVPNFDGILEYKLKAIYEMNSYPKSYGTISMDYLFKQDLPTSAAILYREARPGDVLAFAINYPEDDETFSLSSNLGGFEAEFMPYEKSLIVYMPINWWTTPKDYSATIYRETDEGREIFEEYKLTVLPDDFVTEYQYLEVSDELKEKTDPVKTANDGVLVAKAKSNPNPTSYVEGTFIMPIDGELGTSYAMTRYINGASPYRHSGLDIDGETGDPIVACNNGVIVYAGPLVRPGNTVIIDHGMGLYTSYLHLSGFAVEVGDYVEKGEVVAYVGSTGFSTGPHLHWSITLYGNYMSPLWLVENPIVPD